jgi:hypothetical protein
MSQTLKQNKFIVSVLVITIIFAGMTIGNLPPPGVSQGIQVIDGTTFNFADYCSVDDMQLALFNYLNTLVSTNYQPYGSWDGWYADDFFGLQHYVLAFLQYTASMMFESTPGYRTDYYRDFSLDLIKKMNTTEAVWGNNSIEYREWSNPAHNFVDYWWPNATSPGPGDIYVGGFRGPANIMWTGHYALMMSLYERNFHTDELADEISWYVSDWNNSLTTDGLGNPKEGGIWGVGLIPCEPYIVFVQCNSIPLLTTELYDNMYNTSYMEGGMWDYGLNFIEENMTDSYGLFTDGYYVMEPMGFTSPSPTLVYNFPGPSLDRITRDGQPQVSSYCNGWALAFLEYPWGNKTVPLYPVFIDVYGREVSGDKMYIIDSYHHPSTFGTYDILGSLFTLQLAKQRGDFVTRDRILNFLWPTFNQVWSEDGRMMHFDTMSLEPFLQTVMAFGWIWAKCPVSIKDLGDARSSEFWGYPYISSADDANIWVYQAQWDPVKSGFILNIRVDQAATVTFSNFHNTPIAYSGGAVFQELSSYGADYVLSLSPGTYQLVIMEGS